MKRTRPPWVLILGIIVPSLLRAQTAATSRVEPNIVYGMYSGLALLMDVHRPAQPNGYGIIFVGGSGWTSPLAYDAPALKQTPQVEVYGKPLLDAGFTVFAINHRSAPRFRYPAAVEDAQRAVRFIRYNAKRFGIRPDRIGAVGGSSGGHLVSMLGTMDGTGDAGDPDPINHESAKVQCVVARAAPSDLLNVTGGGAALISFLGMILSSERSLPPPTSLEYRTFRDASPIHYVTKDDPPFLLMHGDADPIVSFKHSEVMEQALKTAGVPTKLLRVAGGGHGPTFSGATNPPDYLGEMVRWLQTHLMVK
jgi:acetyl esterase/lipase